MTKGMWRPLGVLPAVVLLFVVLPATRFMSTRASTTAGDAARGDYLVNQVAMCAQCHSSRSAAPRIAGLPDGWPEEDFVRFLKTGDPGDRPRPLAPMPPFRMNDADARAVAAYLKTLR